MYSSDNIMHFNHVKLRVNFLSTAIFIRQAVLLDYKTNLGIFCKCISRVGSDAALGLAIHYALMHQPLPMYLLNYVKCSQLGK
jgi:hypothetical protein